MGWALNKPTLGVFLAFDVITILHLGYGLQQLRKMRLRISMCLDELSEAA
jgi:hypothetical protein